MPRIVRFADYRVQGKGRMTQSFQDNSFPLLISYFSKSLSFLCQSTVPVFELHQLWSQKCVCWAPSSLKKGMIGVQEGHCWCIQQAMSLVLKSNLGVFMKCGFTGLASAGLLCGLEICISWTPLMNSMPVVHALLWEIPLPPLLFHSTGGEGAHFDST